MKLKGARSTFVADQRVLGFIKTKILLRPFASTCFVLLLFPLSAWAQTKKLPTPVPTPIPTEEIQVLVVPESEPPSPPAGLRILTLKEGVYLSWDPAPAGTLVASYNVFRSGYPGGGYTKVNSTPLSSPTFLDGPNSNQDFPKNGENYFYVVEAVGVEGKVSPRSDEIAVTPQGMETPQALAAKSEPTPVPTEEGERVLNLPDATGINFQLPADSQLSIEGHKKIAAEFTFKDYVNGTRQQGSNPQANTSITQELVVSLKGKVGKNVDVNVDFSDVNRPGSLTDSRQNISIVYNGNEDSPVEKVTFGDLQLYLPNTEFAGFSKQLFGLEAKVKLGDFRVSSFFAQTKGIAATKIFRGNYVQVDKTIQDIEYIRQKYYLITKDFLPVVQGTKTVNGRFPKENSEQIWVEMNTVQSNIPGPNFRGTFAKFLPGSDYTIDYATGVITFLKYIPLSARIAVAYIQKDGSDTPVGFEPDNVTVDLNESTLNVPADGKINNGAHLIKNNDNTISPLYLVNYFDMGRDKIIPPQQDPDFRFEVIDQGNQNTLQTGQADAEFTRGMPITVSGLAHPWHYQVDQDLNLLIVDDLNNAVFSERPFGGADGGLGSNGVYNQSQGQVPTSKYRVHLVYKTKLDFFRVDQFNVIYGSESVFLDGRRLRRNYDYSFENGTLDFLDKSILRPDSQIVVSYEYSPFGNSGQSTILGARAEYDIDKRLFLGSTLLSTGSQKPLDVPQVGTAPNSLFLLDADARLEVRSEDFQSVLGIIPGLENWKPQIKLNLSGEVAQSSFNPNTFDSEGEKGVAMLDNMESVDNTVGPSISSTSWLVSSRPLASTNLPALSPSAAATTSNRFRFYNEVTGMVFQTATSVITGIPGTGGHAYAQTLDQTNITQVLVVPYSGMSDQRWGGVRQVLSTTGTDVSNARNFETWLYNDGNEKWIMFDFGIFSEDSNGNTGLDADIDTVNNTFATGNTYKPDYGIPTFYFPGNLLPGTGGSSSVSFTGLPGELESQEGMNRSLIPRTEDMNANQAINPISGGGFTLTGLDQNDSYFEYGIKANWNGWKLVKIPVDFNGSNLPPTTTTPDQDQINYFFYKQGGTPNPQVIRGVRMWATGTSATETKGYFLVENAGFTRNLWQLQVDPDAANRGEMVNTSLFNVDSISNERDSRYPGSLRFVTLAAGQPTTAILKKEKSLKISYNLSSYYLQPPNDLSGKPVFYATRNFGQAQDVTDFEELRMDIQVRSASPGEVFFVRLGNDQNNYFQYNLQLSSLPVNSWKNDIVIPLDGSAGNMKKVGTPFTNRTVLVSVGVLSTNTVPGSPGEVWINNLRLTSPVTRSGLARRANAALVLGDNFATINARYKEVDSGFAQIDQTSSRFQHSTQLGAVLSSGGVKLFSQPLVTEFSVSRQDTYTEEVLKKNPTFLPLPDTKVENITGNLSYNKDFGSGFGRLTSLRVSGSSVIQSDTYQQDYLLSQSSLQGNSAKGTDNFTLSSIYEAPDKLFFLHIGTNQLRQTYTLARDKQDFANSTIYVPYDRTTRTQTYGWANSTEIVKNLVLSPGYDFSLIEAVGNTNNPGIGGKVDQYISFQERYSPKARVVFSGIPGLTPSVDYSGSNQFDYTGFTDGVRFTNANNLNYALSLNPGTWLALFQKIGLSITASRNESASSSVPGYGQGGELSLEERWGLEIPKSLPALTASKSTAHQVRGNFRLFDVLDFQSISGSWSDHWNLLSKGTNPVQRTERTLGLTTIYAKKIFTLPMVDFNLNSATFQYTHTDSIQYDSSDQHETDTAANRDDFLLTFPYDIAQKAQGNIRLQHAVGQLNNRGILTNQRTDSGLIEYSQKFAPNLEIHLPFINSKIKLQDAIEFRATFLGEFVDNVSPGNPYNSARSEKYRGTIDFYYNPSKNIRVGLGFANEYYTDKLIVKSPLSYVLLQANVSVDARF